MEHGKSFNLVVAVIFVMFLPRLAEASAEAKSPAAQGADPNALIVSTPWLRDNLDSSGLVLLDARGADAYAAGHIPGALRLSLPKGRDGVESVQQRLGEQGLSGAERVVLYGDEASYTAVGWLFWLLEWAGAGPVQVLDGGFEAWEAAGGAVEVVPRVRPATIFVAQADERVATSPGDVLAQLGERDFEVLDLRDGVDWRQTGYEAPPAYAAGHIPNSLPHDVSALISDPGRWPREEDLRAELGRIGPRQGTYVRLSATFTLYGVDDEDQRPGLGYLLLRLAGVPVQVLPGGWQAWSASPASPVVRIVDAATLKALLERENPGLAVDAVPHEMMLFDNRGDYAFDADHIPGAFSLAAEDFADDFAAVAAQHWPGADPSRTPVAFYCYGRECVRSRYCSTKAARAGYQNLLWFRDGFPAWLAADLPRYHGGASRESATSSARSPAQEEAARSH